MNVLSTFDGISCGMVALERAGIPVERYVAYEIEPKAIEISKKNYPQIEQKGDVITADFAQYEGFDLLIGGSPCQDLSIYKEGKKEKAQGLSGEKSSLFYHYVRALKEVKPKYFMLENVAKEMLRIRKLTPKECFRLMGFEDSDFEKAEAVNSNTQLYKQAGNSIVVPVVERIIESLFDCSALERKKERKNEYVEVKN